MFHYSKIEVECTHSAIMASPNETTIAEIANVEVDKQTQSNNSFERSDEILIELRSVKKDMVQNHTKLEQRIREVVDGLKTRFEYSDQKGNIKFFSYTVLVGCYLIELSMTTVSKCLCAFTVEDIVKLLLTVYIYIIFAADSKL